MDERGRSERAAAGCWRTADSCAAACLSGLHGELQVPIHLLDKYALLTNSQANIHQAVRPCMRTFGRYCTYGLILWLHHQSILVMLYKRLINSVPPAMHPSIRAWAVS